MSNVRGLDDLKAKFKQVPVDISKKVLRRMGSAGSKVTKAAVVAGTPRRTGLAQRAVITVFAREKSSDDQATYIVTYRQGKKQQQIKRGRGTNSRLVNLDAYYIKWVERGHRIVARKGRSGLTRKERRAASTGYVAGVFFFAKALRSAASRALTAMVDTGNAEINKVLR